MPKLIIIVLKILIGWKNYGTFEKWRIFSNKLINATALFFFSQTTSCIWLLHFHANRIRLAIIDTRNELQVKRCDVLDVLLKTNEYQSIMSIFMLVYLEMAEDD